MIKSPLTISLPAILALGSLLGLIVLLMATNPVDKIGYAMLFFLLLLIFLVSLGHLILKRFKGEVRPRDRYRIFIASIFLVTLLMFRSAQSLGWVDGSVLFAVTVGLLFYSGRR